MGRKVVAMDVKLAGVLAGRIEGITVTQLCAQLDISRQTFYKYRRRFAEEGIEGLRERSRCPLRSPTMISAELEDAIVRLRKELRVDNGAASIRDHLRMAGIDPPATSTIHRALRRRGLVEDQPQKRPRSSWKRFEWPRANDLWQMDATSWAVGSRECWIFNVLDDHSRKVPASRVHWVQTEAAAWDCFNRAVATCGLPMQLLTDGGSCYTARGRAEGQSMFEAKMEALDVRHILSAPYHPQTCGKVERFHQTLKRHLAIRPPAKTIARLQDDVDDFLDFYNHRRPHRALGGTTPADRFETAELGGPITTAKDVVVEVKTLKVHPNGSVLWRPFLIGLGYEWRGVTMTVLRRGHDVWVFAPDRLVRRLTIDPTKSYQPSGVKRGPKPGRGGPTNRVR